MARWFLCSSILLGWGLTLVAAAPAAQFQPGLASLAHRLHPGEFKTFTVKAEPGQVGWRLEGPGQFVQEEPGGGLVEYRAPRAGGGSCLLIATSQLDPSQQVRYTLTLEPNPTPAPPPVVDLLPLLRYQPAERNQGSCSNCYAWAATAAIEAEMARRYGLRDRLSIQYFHTLYVPRVPEDSSDPCCANSFSAVLEAYGRSGRMVPWGNPNAHYQERASRCDVPRPAREPVGLLPHYRVRRLESQQVETRLWEDQEVIAELKAVLARNKLVINKTDGHYTVIVGYDASHADPAEHCWKFLDSNGSLAATPAMVRSVPMGALGYSELAGPNNDRYQFDFIDDLELDLQPERLPASTVAPAKATLSVGESLRLVASVGGRPPVTYQWLKDGVALPGQTGAILELPSVTRLDAGSYAVQVVNGTGAGLSAPVPVTVVDSGLPLLRVQPLGATLGAGTSCSFTAILTGCQAPGVFWSLEGGGRLLDPAANPVVYVAPAGPEPARLTVRAAAIPQCEAQIPITVKTLDLNGDGTVDVLDLAVLAKAYRTMAGDPLFEEAADLNGDGSVDEADATAFLQQLDARP